METIERAIERFRHWLLEFGYLSYDQFDFWGSRPGIFAKKLFYKNKILAAPLVILLQVLESFLPRSRALFAPKRRFAIGDAHFAMGYMNLYEYTNESGYLDAARELLAEMRSSATRTASGLGWGYPYTWVTSGGIYAPGTPFITVTPYAAEASLRMHEITGEQHDLDMVAASARFAAFDLKETVVSPEETAAGYGTGDNRLVINANAYRAALLLKAFQLFGITEYKEKALKNLRYVLNWQQPDGSWPYAEDEPFIDNFHTCFVLKNLYKAYSVLKDDRPGSTGSTGSTGDGKTLAEEIMKAVKKGYEYYRREMFRPDGTPVHFTKQTSPKFRKIEMYDYAEGISLGTLINQDIPCALEFSAELARHLIESFQLRDGHFVTRVTTFNTRNTVPYLRWPQAQLFYALTSLLLESGPKAPGGENGDTIVQRD